MTIHDVVSGMVESVELWYIDVGYGNVVGHK